jgi:CheY-like chemotaxis protein
MHLNGWEFLEQYNKLDKQLQGSVIVVMLTTSDNPDDKLKAIEFKIPADFRTKPLTKEMLEEIINKHFND